jgi:hypothetical protein
MKDIPLSSIGGAANSGSAKSPQERREEERKQPGREHTGNDAKREENAGVTPSAPQAGLESEADDRDKSEPREWLP